MTCHWELNSEYKYFFILYLHSRGLVLICMDSYNSESRRIFQHFSRSTVAPIGGKKSVHTFLPPEKKEHLEDLGGALERPGGYQRLTSGQPSVNLGSTLGQPWVNVGSTFGIFPSHLGPIFADFAEFVD